MLDRPATEVRERMCLFEFPGRLTTLLAYLRIRTIAVRNTTQGIGKLPDELLLELASHAIGPSKAWIDGIFTDDLVPHSLSGLEPSLRSLLNLALSSKSLYGPIEEGLMRGCLGCFEAPYLHKCHVRSAPSVNVPYYSKECRKFLTSILSNSAKAAQVHSLRVRLDNCNGYDCMTAEIIQKSLKDIWNCGISDQSKRQWNIDLLAGSFSALAVAAILHLPHLRHLSSLYIYLPET